MGNEPTKVWILYVGPDKAESDYFGETLVAGRRYQAPADFAAYLCAAHPDHWQADAPPVSEE